MKDNFIMYLKAFKQKFNYSSNLYIFQKNDIKRFFFFLKVFFFLMKNIKKLPTFSYCNYIFFKKHATFNFIDFFKFFPDKERKNNYLLKQRKFFFLKNNTNNFLKLKPELPDSHKKIFKSTYLKYKYTLNRFKLLKANTKFCEYWNTVCIKDGDDSKVNLILKKKKQVNWGIPILKDKLLAYRTKLNDSEGMGVFKIFSRQKLSYWCLRSKAKDPMRLKSYKKYLLKNTNHVNEFDDKFFINNNFEKKIKFKDNRIKEERKRVIALEKKENKKRKLGLEKAKAREDNWEILKNNVYNIAMSRRFSEYNGDSILKKNFILKFLKKNTFNKFILKKKKYKNFIKFKSNIIIYNKKKNNIIKKKHRIKDDTKFFKLKNTKNNILNNLNLFFNKTFYLWNSKNFFLKKYKYKFELKFKRSLIIKKFKKIKIYRNLFNRFKAKNYKYKQLLLGIKRGKLLCSTAKFLLNKLFPLKFRKLFFFKKYWNFFYRINLVKSSIGKILKNYLNIYDYRRKIAPFLLPKNKLILKYKNKRKKRKKLLHNTLKFKKIIKNYKNKIKFFKKVKFFKDNFKDFFDDFSEKGEIFKILKKKKAMEFLKKQELRKNKYFFSDEETDDYDYCDDNFYQYNSDISLNKRMNYSLIFLKKKKKKIVNKKNLNFKIYKNYLKNSLNFLYEDNINDSKKETNHVLSVLGLKPGFIDYKKSIDMKLHIMNIFNAVKRRSLIRGGQFLFTTNNIVENMNLFYQYQNEKWMLKLLFMKSIYARWFNDYISNKPYLDKRAKFFFNRKKLFLINIIKPSILNLHNFKRLVVMNKDKKNFNVNRSLNIIIHNYFYKLFYTNYSIILTKFRINSAGKVLSIFLSQLLKVIKFEAIRPDFLLEFISVSALTFLSKDPKPLVKWIIKVINKISHKKHWKFIFLLKTNINIIANKFIKETNFTGFHLRIRGKIGALGSVRKKIVHIKTGEYGFSKYYLKGDIFYLSASTMTGKIGVKMIICYR